MQNQLAVIMFADIVGYSAMMEADQEQAVANVRALRHSFLEPVVRQYDGRVLKRLGDGWILSFESLSACMDCAVEVQTNMSELTGVKLRIGCHFGDIVEDEEDIYGSGVNIAARIQAEAPPGGVMISEDMMRQLSGKRAEAMKEAGVFRLKNIAQPVRLYQWRPAQQSGPVVDAATSIALAATEYAPLDPETAMLAEDLRDQLFNRMSRRVGVEIYDATHHAVKEATYDLLSRLRVSGGRGRLSLSLVLRSEGRRVWSETYERSTDDIFDFCDEVLQRAEADLRLQTNAFDGDRLAHVPDDALSVSELRSRAANLFYRVSGVSWRHGKALMDRAVGLNPDDGVALAMRVEAEFTLATAEYREIETDALARMETDLAHAVENSANSDYVFWTRGLFRVLCLGDVPSAASDLAICRRLNAAYMEVHELEGHLKMMREDYTGAAESYALLLQRQTLDPLTSMRGFMRSVALYCAGDFEAAAAQAKLDADLRPMDWMLHAFCVMAFSAAGDATGAARYREKTLLLPRNISICGRKPVLPPCQDALAQRLSSAYHTGDLG